MITALSESKELCNLILTDDQIEIINFTLDKIKESPTNYSLEKFWKMDKSIAGIGGFCLPANPLINPYPAGIKRELYRPLQYIRSVIELQDIRFSARQVVMYSGMHLEAAVRLFLIENNRIFGFLRFSKTTLGKAAVQLKNYKLIEPDIVEGLFKFVPLYNKSKHDVNQDETRPRLFSSADALIAYVAARIIGVYILNLLPTNVFDRKIEV